MDSRVGYIYSYFDKGILSPNEYKLRRRTTGIGIVVSDSYNIVRIASLELHNNMELYPFMEGEGCLDDLNEVQSFSKECNGIRDLSGRSNTSNIIKSSCDSTKFVWNSIRYSNEIYSKYKNEVSTWYVPSLGELKRLYDSRDKVLSSMELCNIKNCDLYKALTSNEFNLVSTTQASDKEVYCMDIVNGLISKVNKTENVRGISFKMLCI